MEKHHSTGSVLSMIRHVADLQKFKSEKKAYFETLTKREAEVLALVAEGKENPEIAEELKITRVTVQNHRANIRQKLYITRETDYLKYALAYDLVPF